MTKVFLCTNLIVRSFFCCLIQLSQKKKKNSCQYEQDIETLAFNEGCAPDTRIGNSALGVKKL